MIEIKNLSKSYGKKKAVDDISFTVDRGEVLGFLGPNGAGKSTTMNIITGYISSSEGSVTIDGFDVVEDSAECKKRIGYLPEIPPLYNDMTVEEYLDFVYDIKKVKEDRKTHIGDIVELVKINDVLGRLIKNLSKGYKQRVGIAQALIGNPEILILDEPTVGLDPKQIIEIRNVIKELGRDRTVILSSHILPEVSAICERVIIINNGKIAAIDTPENLSKSLTSDSKFVVRVEGEEELIEEALKEVEGVIEVTPMGCKEEGSFDFMVESEKESDVRKDVFKALALKDMPILMSKSMDMSLEDIFIQLTEDIPEEEPFEAAEDVSDETREDYVELDGNIEDMPSEQNEIYENDENTEADEDESDI